MTDLPQETPTLRAGRVCLRPFCDADLGLVREVADDPYIPLVTTVPVPFTEEEGLKFIERQHDRLRQGLGYSFVIADTNDLAVGSIMLRLTNIKDGRASIGYWIRASQRGRHFAGQALAEIARWARDDLHIPRLELYAEPWNRASIQVAERTGFLNEGLLRSWQYVGKERRDFYVYALTMTEMMATMDASTHKPKYVRPAVLSDLDQLTAMDHVASREESRVAMIRHGIEAGRGRSE